MRFIFLLSITTIAAFFFFFPSHFIFGAIVPPCINDAQGQCGWGWPELIQLGQNLLGYLVLIAGSLAAISFAYAGWLYLTSGGEAGKVTKAREIFTKVAIGLILVLCAWLIVHMIVKLLGVDQNYSLIKTS